MGSRCRLLWTPLAFPTKCWRPTRIWPPTRRSACRPRMPSRLPRSCTGQLAVAAYDDLGRLRDATGVQIPGVLDDVYGDAVDSNLGVTWRGGVPTLAVWAPTAKDVDLLLRPAGASSDTTVQMRRGSDGVWTVNGRPPMGWRVLPVRRRGLRPVDRQGRDEHRHRSVQPRPDHELAALGRRQP